ncbi:phosphotransferase [Fictibacillus sp. WQ 8-8]|uniref:phosphotransferase n=1 Tax=Fictibacillus sp. WQ 8-8 TaxID=2938788 RepID=UPI00210D6070|nr:phosphotransferase [Fictibacillus sp. WQ 8-8]MCQ6267483.1 phosphotransferase [Fictibacillus sp. WQ 8-8]
MKQDRGQKVFLSDAVLSSLIYTHYGLTVQSIERVLAIPKVHTDQGIFGFKNANELNDLPFVAHCIEWMKQNHFSFIPSVLPCHNGQVYFEHGNELYYMEEWAKGRDILFADLSLCERIGATLAHFHHAADGAVPPPDSSRMEYGSRVHKLIGVYQDIQKWKTEYKPVPEWTFEPWMLDVLETRCRLAYSYIHRLEEEHGEVKGALCHGSLHQRNILLDGDQKIYFIDVESLVFAERPYDLASFIHYYAPSYNWNPAVIHRFIKGYQEHSVQSLSFNEWKFLFSFLAFPRRVESWCYRHFGSQTPSESTYFKLLGILVHDQPKESLFTQFHPETLESSFHLFHEMVKGRMG